MYGDEDELFDEASRGILSEEALIEEDSSKIIREVANDDWNDDPEEQNQPRFADEEEDQSEVGWVRRQPTGRPTKL